MSSHQPHSTQSQPLLLLSDRFSGCSLIEASAGTGKTWTLTALYARLLLERQLSVGQILVVTYTQAATAELRERIRARLANLLALYEGRALEEEDALCQQLYEQYKQDETSHRRILLAVHGFDEASIFTIHGFCQRALQEAAFEAGGDFDNELTPDDRDILDALLNDLWRAELAKAEPLWARFLASEKITPVLLRQRLRAHLGKPYLRVEPAAEPVVADLSALEQAWQCAAEAWQQSGTDWIETLAAHSGLSQITHKSSKFAGWGLELEGYFAGAACLFDAPEALRKLGSAALHKACKKGQSIPASPLTEALDRLIKALEAALPACAQRLVSLQVRLLEQLNSELPKRKAAQRLQAFDDLLNQLQQALEGSSGAHLAKTLREQYPLALIDEFQDTDPIQYAIFRHIYVPESSAEDTPAADLCFVGDPKQAIYGFRGADLHTYLQAREQTAQRYNLSTNYRSTPALLGALNRLFSRPLAFSEDRLVYQPVLASDKARAPLRLPEAEGDAALSLVWLGDGPLTKGQADGLVALDTARRIARILSAASRNEAGFSRSDGFEPLKGGDIAVLVANHRQASLIANALSEHAVPSVRRGRDSVWHSEEAQELAAVLAVYAEPTHEGWLRYALATRLLGRSAEKLEEAQNRQDLWDAERETAERYHELWQKQGFLRLFRVWLDEQEVAENLLTRDDGERRLTNLLHLGELLQAEYQRRPGMEPLLRWFAEQREGEGLGDDALLRLESDAERVQIVTIHTSKGLEYPLVFCPFLWDGRLLGKRRETARCHSEDGQPLLDLGSDALGSHLESARQETFAEQLRLVYVALTRPRERLWIHWGPVAQQPKKDGSLSEEGLHTSAMAWLLHARDCAQAPVLEQLAEHLKQQSPAGVRADLEALAEDSNGQIACLPLDEQEASASGELRAQKPEQLSQLSRSLHSTWRVGSFSGLTAGVHKEAPDRDGLALPSSSEPGSGIFAFPRGARAGTCLHAILEDWARGKGSLDELSGPALIAHGLPEEATALIAQHLQQVVDTDLNGQGLRLSALEPSRCLPELGFTFPVRELDVVRLSALLSDPAMALPEPLREAAAHLKFDNLRGFLKGFIDLTFEHQGRWYILDYKSNWLGPDASHYQGEHLLHALAKEHYYLQYLIYLVALRRFLRLRLADFHDDQLGGAYYLFLRAMPEAGVYFARPSDALLDALDRLFEEGC